VVAGGLVMMTYILIDAGKRIFNNMYVEKNQAVRGKIDRDQVYDPTNIKIYDVKDVCLSICNI
jgi:hypothetical protein